MNADISAQLFATINLMLSPDWAVALSVVVVLLLLTFLITSADSGILIINTLASGGSQNQKGAGHIVIWGGIFAVLIGALLSAGGMDALRSTDPGSLTLLHRDGPDGHRSNQGHGKRRAIRFRLAVPIAGLWQVGKVRCIGASPQSMLWRQDFSTAGIVKWV